MSVSFIICSLIPIPYCVHAASFPSHTVYMQPHSHPILCTCSLIPIPYCVHAASFPSHTVYMQPHSHPILCTCVREVHTCLKINIIILHEMSGCGSIYNLCLYPRLLCVPRSRWGAPARSLERGMYPFQAQCPMMRLSSARPMSPSPQQALTLTFR